MFSPNFHNWVLIFLVMTNEQNSIMITEANKRVNNYGELSIPSKDLIQHCNGEKFIRRVRNLRSRTFVS